MPDFSKSNLVQQGQRDSSQDELLFTEAIQRDEISSSISQNQNVHGAADSLKLGPLPTSGTVPRQHERDSCNDPAPCTNSSKVSPCGLLQQKKEKQHRANALRFALRQVDPRCFVTGARSADLALHYVLEPNHGGSRLWRKIVCR